MKNTKKVVTNEELAERIESLAKNFGESIENLAVITAKGFAAVDMKFDVVTNEIIEVKSRLTRVEGRLEIVEDRLVTVEENVAGIRYGIFNQEETFVKMGYFEAFVTKNKLRSV